LQGGRGVPLVAVAGSRDATGHPSRVVIVKLSVYLSHPPGAGEWNALASVHHQETDSMDTDARQVLLHEITAETVRRITGLAVSLDQQRFVASNAISLAEALFHEEAWYRAIYVGDSPAGFVMLYDESLRATPPPAPQVGLWRFMIDSTLQGRGIGAAALRQVVAHVRSKGLFTSLATSYAPGPGCPEQFYLRAGFRHTGKVDDGEVVLELPLVSNSP